MGEREERLKEMYAIMAEQEQINAGFHTFLLQSTTPDAIALRERLEALQGRIMRARLDEP